MKAKLWPRLRERFLHAFSMPGQEPLTDQEQRVLQRVVDVVVSKKLTLPAEMFLESSRPLSFLAGQGLAFLRPLLEPFFNTSDYALLAQALEKKGSVDGLLQAIETQRKSFDNQQASANPTGQPDC